METDEQTQVVKREDVEADLPAEAQDRTKLPTGMLEPVAQPSEVVKARTERSEMIADALEEGRDYGSVRGIPKPFLHKPGAERLTDAFGCYPRFRILDQEVDHDRRVEWEKRSGKSGTSRGLYRYVVSCDLIHRASGIVVGNGLGACSTMEDKYVESPRNAENTCLKMAKKRAHVDAALSTFGLSEMFTQDSDYVKQDGGRDRAPSGQSEHACPECGGPIWDNTDDDKAAANGGKWPNFKCKAQEECGWASWDSEEEVFGKDEDEGPSEERQMFRALVERAFPEPEDRSEQVRWYARQHPGRPDALEDWTDADFEAASKDIGGFDDMLDAFDPDRGVFQAGQAEMEVAG